MAWIYFRELVESELASANRSEQSPIVSKIDTHKASYCPECDQVTLMPLRSGTMSLHFAARCCQESTSSAEGSPVRTSALQVVERAWKESGQVSSMKYAALLASFDPDSYSWKMCQQSLFEDSTRWDWPSLKWGMIVDGQLSQPQALEPPINAKGGFYWPTPCARDWKDTGKSPSEMRRNSVTLATIAGGQLNPMWVEWLMGYRIGHTELDALVIQWFHSKLPRRLKYSATFKKGEE